MKRLNKIFFALTLTTIIFNICGIFGYDVYAAATSYKDMADNAKSFIQAGSASAADVDTAEIAAQFVEIGKLLTTIGAGVMVAVTIYMGIKYLTSPPDAQAKLKQQLIGVVVAGIVVFGAYGIWSTVLKIAENFDT